jgi:predicted membrane chloride channel (bestrophin family)
VFIVFLVSFTLYGIEGIAEEIEDPFGKDENGILQFSSLTQTLKLIR